MIGIIILVGSEECQFKFPSVSENEIRKVILNMDEKKANLTGDIPGGIVKGFLKFLYLLKYTRLLYSRKRMG